MKYFVLKCAIFGMGGICNIKPLGFGSDTNKHFLTHIKHLLKEKCKVYLYSNFETPTGMIEIIE